MDGRNRKPPVITSIVQNIVQRVSQGVESLNQLVVGNPPNDTTMNSLPKDLDKGLLQELECPVCMEYMKPPITMCENGHNICPNCRPKLNNCPSCTKPFLQVRNLALESLSRQALDQKLQTKDNILPQVVKCPFASISNEDCSWSGPVTTIKDHVKLIHNNENDTHEAKDDFNIILTGLAPLQHYRKAVFTLNELFYICWQIRDGSFYCVVMYAGDENNSSKYKYKFTIASDCGEKKISMSFPTRCILENIEEIIQSGECIILNYNTVIKFVNINTYLECEFQINTFESESVTEGSTTSYSARFDEITQMLTSGYDTSRRHRRSRRHEKEHHRDEHPHRVKPGRCPHGKRVRHCKACKYTSHVQDPNAATGAVGGQLPHNKAQQVGFYCAPSTRFSASGPVGNPDIGFRIPPNAPPMEKVMFDEPCSNVSPEKDSQGLLKEHAHSDIPSESTWVCRLCGQIAPRKPEPQPEPGWHASSSTSGTKWKCALCGQMRN